MTVPWWSSSFWAPGFNDAAALIHFQQGLKALRTSTGKRKVFFADFPGLFLVFLLLRSGEAKSRTEAPPSASKNSPAVSGT